MLFPYRRRRAALGLKTHAFDRAVWLGWFVVFLCVAIAFLWQPVLNLVIDRDARQHQEKIRKLQEDHRAKFPDFEAAPQDH